MARLVALSFIAVLILGALPVQAQVGSSAPLYITLTPDYPRAFGQATVVVRSDTIDLYGSTITISVNGTVVERGSGVTSAVFTLGGPGTRTTVTATAVNQGRTYSVQKTISPADVALIMEPVSTNHPFYEGGALVPSEGRVRLIAIPDLRTSAGAVIPAQNLVYTWRAGNKVLQSESGIGKNVLVAASPVRYRDALITVTVTTQDQSIVAQGSTLVSPVDPIVRIYRNDPLLGPDYANALRGTVALKGAEDAFRMVPFFFSSMPTIAWSVNGTVNETSNVITLRSTGGGAGTASINASARNSSTFQSAEAPLSVRFGEERGIGIFGL